MINIGDIYQCTNAKYPKYFMILELGWNNSYESIQIVWDKSISGFSTGVVYRSELNELKLCCRYDLRKLNEQEALIVKLKYF